MDVLPLNHDLFLLFILLFNYKVVLLGGWVGGGVGWGGEGGVEERICVA